MRKLILPVALAAMLAIPTTANAAPYLTKVRAHAKAISVVRGMWADLHDADDYDVETSYDCSRWRSNVVDCDYTIYFASGVECTDTVRVRLLSWTNRVTFTFPYKADCA